MSVPGFKESVKNFHIFTYNISINLVGNRHVDCSGAFV